MHQDVDLYAANLTGAQSVEFAFRPKRYGWLQVARGDVTLNGRTMHAGDGAAITDEPSITITGDGAEILLFDLN